MKSSLNISRLFFLNKGVIAWVLLFIISISILPVSLIHHHSSEEKACQKENKVLENNPCHVSIYHTKNVGAACKHKIHIHQKFVTCKLCEFFRTVMDYTIPEQENYVAFEKIRETASFCLDLYSHQNVSSFFNKGPPSL